MLNYSLAWENGAVVETRHSWLGIVARFYFLIAVSAAVGGLGWEIHLLPATLAGIVTGIGAFWGFIKESKNQDILRDHHLLQMDAMARLWENGTTATPKSVSTDMPIFAQPLDASPGHLVRLSGRPGVRFLERLYRAWHDENGRLWGEERIRAACKAAGIDGDSNAWLDDLARLGYIVGRDAATRDPGALRGTYEGITRHFRYDSTTN